MSIKTFFSFDCRNGSIRLQISEQLFWRLKIGDNYPVYQLNSYMPIIHGPVRPLKEKREFNKPITFETIYDPNEKVNFQGSPVSGLTWLKDGEHYLHVRDGRLYKVHSESGRSIPFFDPNELAKGLKSLPTMNEKAANSLSKQKRFTMNPGRSAVLIDYENDLYYCTLGGKNGGSIDEQPGRREIKQFRSGREICCFCT